MKKCSVRDAGEELFEVFDEVEEDFEYEDDEDGEETAKDEL